MFANGYRVLFEDFAKRHYVKDFEKKYKNSWLVTQKAIVVEFRNIDMLLQSGRTNPPIHCANMNSELIIKHEFVVAGRRESRKSSGCRLIAYVNHNEKVVRILLVYHKDHLGKSGSETSVWEKMIKAEFATLLENFSF